MKSYASLLSITEEKRYYEVSHISFIFRGDEMDAFHLVANIPTIKHPYKIDHLCALVHCLSCPYVSKVYHFMKNLTSNFLYICNKTILT